jgi:hypothetical protein
MEQELLFFSIQDQEMDQVQIRYYENVNPNNLAMSWRAHTIGGQILLGAPISTHLKQQKIFSKIF